jgi:hypothetical protein
MSRGGSRCGAGRPGWKGKAEHRVSLDVRRLARGSFLAPGMAYSWQWSRDGEACASVAASTSRAGDRLTLRYRWTPDGGEPANVECQIRLETTPCHYGGERTWFSCPRCGRRCAVAYFAGALFACRKCLNLAYASQSEDGLARTRMR